MSSEEIAPNHWSLSKPESATAGLAVASRTFAAVTVIFVSAVETSVVPSFAVTGSVTVAAAALARGDAVAPGVPEFTFVTVTLVAWTGVAVPPTEMSRAPTRPATAANPNRPAFRSSVGMAIEATGTSGSLRSRLIVNAPVNSEPVSSCGAERNLRFKSESSPASTWPHAVGLASGPRSSGAVVVALAAIDTASSIFVAVEPVAVTVGVTVICGPAAPAVVASAASCVWRAVARPESVAVPPPR